VLRTLLKAVKDNGYAETVAAPRESAAKIALFFQSAALSRAAATSSKPGPGTNRCNYNMSLFSHAQLCHQNPLRHLPGEHNLAIENDRIASKNLMNPPRQAGVPPVQPSEVAKVLTTDGHGFNCRNGRKTSDSNFCEAKPKPCKGGR
jgi:hypothetical protein